MATVACGSEAGWSAGCTAGQEATARSKCPGGAHNGLPTASATPASEAAWEALGGVF